MPGHQRRAGGDIQRRVDSAIPGGPRGIGGFFRRCGSHLASSSQNGGDKEDPSVTYNQAPMVGTFYRAPSPESAPFVEVNAKVSENSVICIIEAMKIMNEIQAEAKGTVVEILVENGQPVEYGQRLFKIKQG